VSIKRLSRLCFTVSVIIAVVLFFLPVSGYIGFLCSQAQKGFNLGQLFQGQYFQSLCNTLVLALGTGFFAVIIGTMQAIFLQKVHLPWRLFFLFSYFIPFLIPPYIHAIIWSRILDSNGILLQLLPMLPESRQVLYGYLYSKAGAVLILSIAFIPLVTTVVMAGLQAIDGGQEEAALCDSSPLTVLRKITLPLITPHILGSFLLVILFTLNSFDVPDILRVRVVSVEIFIQLAAMYDEVGALFMSIPLLAFALLLTMTIQRSMRGKVYFGLSNNQNRILLADKRYGLIGFFLLSLIWVLSVALPCVVLFSAIPGIDVFFRSLTGAFNEIIYSTLLALLCAFTSLLCSVPYAYLMARRHPLRTLIDFFSLIPLAVPAALFSLGLIKAGNFLDLQFLSTSSLFCLMGLVAHFLFLGIKILQAGIEQIDVQIEEAAFMSGASMTKVMVTIILPQLKGSVATAFFLVFVCCFSELSATLLLVPPGKSTIAVKIYNLMHYGADDVVASLCLFIIILMAIFGLILKTCFSWSAHAKRHHTS